MFHPFSCRWRFVLGRILIIGVLGLYSQSSVLAEPTQRANLTLREALSLSLERHPDLARFSFRARAAEARALQAGLGPNPEASLEVENLAGSGRFEGTDSAETTLVLSQLIEAGGKRQKRGQVARYQAAMVDRDYELVRWQVLAETVRRFLTVAQAQEQLELAQLSLQLAERNRETVKARVDAGKTSEASLQREIINVTRSRLGVARARQALDSARMSLAVQWGETEGRFDRVSADLFQLTPLPKFSEVRRQLEQSPALARLVTEERLRESELQLAKARGRQDPTVGAGIKHFNETNDYALTLTLSMPLGIRDRNQGEIQARIAEYEQLAVEERALRIQLMARVKRLFQELSVFRDAASQLQAEALPAAKSAFETISRGYQQGLYSYLELTEARRERLAVEREALNAAVNFHQTLVTLEQLTGAGLTQPSLWNLGPEQLDAIDPYRRHAAPIEQEQEGNES